MRVTDVVVAEIVESGLEDGFMQSGLSYETLEHYMSEMSRLYSFFLREMRRTQRNARHAARAALASRDLRRALRGTLRESEDAFRALRGYRRESRYHSDVLTETYSQYYGGD